jgi:hypothetical protein
MTSDVINAFAKAIADYVEQAAYDAATDAQDEITSFPAEGLPMLDTPEADTAPFADPDDTISHAELTDAILDKVALILSKRERTRHKK